VFNRLYRRIYRHVAEMRWDALALFGAGHFGLSWLLTSLVEQTEITAPDVFWYYYLVTATTVGYGDFAPTTAWGRFITVCWVMPGAIALFTTAIAKAAQSMAESWRRNMRGQGDYTKLDQHIVIIGWRGDSSERLLTQLADGGGRAAPEIVIIADTISQNPAPERAFFIRAENMSDPQAFARSGMKLATAAIVMAASDADALTGALTAAAVAPNLRLVVYFEDERMANLLKVHCPTAETAPSLSIELLARAARDAGSAELLYMLASSQEGPTEFSLVTPEDIPQKKFGEAMLTFKREYNAILLGIRHEGERRSTLNPSWSEPVGPGDRLYYVARSRLDASEVDWSLIG